MQCLVRTASWLRDGYILLAVFSHGRERGHLSLFSCKGTVPS